MLDMAPAVGIAGHSPAFAPRSVVAGAATSKTPLNRLSETPGSDGGGRSTADRRSAAEPRVLWSELAGASALSVQPERGGGRRGEGGSGTSGAVAAGRATFSLKEGNTPVEGEGTWGVSSSVLHRDEGAEEQEDEEEEEETRNILAVCRHGDRLGVAAVRNTRPRRVASFSEHHTQ